MQERSAKPPAPSKALEPYKGSIYISLTEVEIQDGTQMSTNASLRRRLVGKAALEHNEAIARAGDDHSSASTFTIGISPITADQAHLTSADAQKKASAAASSASSGATPAPEATNPSFPVFKPTWLSTHGNATLGYIDSDWEYDVQGHWYVELEVIDETFNRIVEIVEQGRLRRLSLRLELSNLLIEPSYSMVGSRHAKLYLAPEGPLENIDPQIMGSTNQRWMQSDGWITSMQVRSSTTQLTSKADEGEDVDMNQDAPSGEKPADKLTAAIERLNITVIWIGVLISIAIYMSS